MIMTRKRGNERCSLHNYAFTESKMNSNNIVPMWSIGFRQINRASAFEWLTRWYLFNVGWHHRGKGVENGKSMEAKCISSGY